jgi:DNA-binding LacI/PurR family transcriptional regulator
VAIGSRRMRAADVAAAAGVSQTTVSLVLNGRSGHVSEATRDKVLAAAAALGYHVNTPARQLASGMTSTIGLVVRQTPEQIAGDAFLAATLHGLAAVARDAGYRVVVEPLPPGEGTYEALLRGQHVDGLVISGPRADDEELSRLVADGFPIVIHGSRPDLDAISVDVDNEAGARTAVNHLLSLGHRRVACVVFELSYVAAQERLAGYRSAMRAAGVEPDPRLIVETGYRAGDTRMAVAELLSREDFTAVFAAADMTAAGVLGALRAARRRVPEDVSLVGFDDIPLAQHLDPPLTTIRVPAVQVGQAVGRALLDRLAGRDGPRRTLLPVELMVRASSAPPTDPPGVR